MKWFFFTEAFYFFAWRLVEVLKGSGAFAFDGFSKLEAKGIRIVRNHLLQHPEKYKKNFQQSLVVTSNGPVLKTMTVVVRSDTGKVEPEDESVDRGLFVNAQELHDEIEERIRKTLEQVHQRKVGVYQLCMAQLDRPTLTLE